MCPYRNSSFFAFFFFLCLYLLLLLIKTLWMRKKRFDFKAKKNPIYYISLRIFIIAPSMRESIKQRKRIAKASSATFNDSPLKNIFQQDEAKHGTKVQFGVDWRNPLNDMAILRVFLLLHRSPCSLYRHLKIWNILFSFPKTNLVWLCDSWSMKLRWTFSHSFNNSINVWRGL